MSLPDLSPFKSDPLAAAALAQITEGKWRKARDTAKELYKKDRTKYLPLLVAANTGLAQEMLDRGLVKDAETVIAYLKTIAPTATVEALESRMRQGKDSSTLTKGTPAEALATAWRLVSAPSQCGTKSSEFQLAADRLAISTELPPGAEAPELRAEWAALRQAIGATANGAWDEAKSALRGIPAQSPFGPWRLFLRGVRCVHTGELDAARQCFEALPSGTAAARAAWAYRPACGLPAGPDVPAAAARATFPAMLCGASPKAAAAIAEADVLWRKKDLASAYTTLIPAFGRGEFPSEAPGIAGTLTDLFFAHDFRSFPVSSEALDDFLYWIDGRLERPASLGPLEEKLMRLQFLRMDGSVMSPEEVLDFAEIIITRDEALRGRPDPLRAAAVWQLAAQALKAERDDGLDAFAPKIAPHPERTIALRHAAQLDPASASRRMALLEHLDLHGLPKDLENLLPQAVSDFPEHPGILALSGIIGTVKGRPGALDQLRKAVRLDPSHAEATTTLFQELKQLLNATRGFDAALWSEMETLSRPSPVTAPDALPPEDVERQRWFFKLRRTLADPATADSPGAVDAALKTAPSPFIGHLALSILTASDPSARRDGSSGLEDGQQVTWNDLIWALHLMQWYLLGKKAPAWHVAMENFLTALAEPLLTVKALCTPDGAKGVMAFARAAFFILEELEGRPGENLPNRFILTAAKAVEHPIVVNTTYQAAIASIMLPAKTSRNIFAFQSCSCAALQQVQAKANAAGDKATAALALKLINLCGNLPSPPWTRLKAPPKKKTAAKTAKKAAPEKVWVSPPQATAGKTAPKASAASPASEVSSPAPAAKKAPAKKASPEPAATAGQPPNPAAEDAPQPPATKSGSGPPLEQQDLFGDWGSN